MAQRYCSVFRGKVVMKACEIALEEGRMFQLSSVAVRIILNAFASVAAEELERGQTVRVPGLGVLYMKDTAARSGVNMHTGRHIPIPAMRRVRFRPSKLLTKRVEKVINE